MIWTKFSSHCEKSKKCKCDDENIFIDEMDIFLRFAHAPTHFHGVNDFYFWPGRVQRGRCNDNVNDNKAAWLRLRV